MVGTSSCLMRLPNLNLTKCETSPLRVYARTLASKPSFPYLRCASPQSSEVILAPSDTLTEVSQSSSVDSKFHPSVWDSHFVDSSSSDSRKPETFSEERINELKKEVKTMLSLASNDPFTELELIDNIQRLGVAYHFETQIEDAIQRIYDNDTHFFDKIVDYQRSDLCATSLWFRLLRQAGYHVSPDVFQKFKDEKGEFHASLASDLQGMLSLYEASYLSFNGEDIMDEAMAFTTKHLKSMVTRLSPTLASQVQQALEIPLQKSIKRVQARHYISIYQEDSARNESLLEFAKLDFNLVQLIHQKEISEITR
ncbi:hypothetical protein IFM89_010184 [Coptis chinensis]|uniref:Terpene synthase N-terminal domain-containing protein n=1 Tax=Coptis chinensis TaxID=261450 RepID=A0A835GVQ7_9MAGN|nr:hypothetical protein IFM89_010184 [Coptis chinensis]